MRQPVLANFSATTGISSIPTKAWTVSSGCSRSSVAPSTASSKSNTAATAAVQMLVPGAPPASSRLIQVIGIAWTRIT